jgi:hypothetical protein
MDGNNRRRTAYRVSVERDDARRAALFFLASQPPGVGTMENPLVLPNDRNRRRALRSLVIVSNAPTMAIALVTIAREFGITEACARNLVAQGRFMVADKIRAEPLDA